MFGLSSRDQSAMDSTGGAKTRPRTDWREITLAFLAAVGRPVSGPSFGNDRPDGRRQGRRRGTPRTRASRGVRSDRMSRRTTFRYGETGALAAGAARIWEPPRKPRDFWEYLGAKATLTARASNDGLCPHTCGHSLGSCLAVLSAPKQPLKNDIGEQNNAGASTQVIQPAGGRLLMSSYQRIR